MFESNEEFSRQIDINDRLKSMMELFLSNIMRMTSTIRQIPPLIFKKRLLLIKKYRSNRLLVSRRISI